MVSIDSPHPGTIDRRGDAGRTATDPPACLLVFSMAGLLTDGLALVMQGETSFSLALVAVAAPVAAMVALRFAGNADERVPLKRMRN
jgi:membrane protein implicated in regulation of membrane protease activity